MNKALPFLALLAFAACGGSGPGPLPNCSPAIPSGATPSLGPPGVSACTEAGAVAITPASDLNVPGYVVVGPAMTFAAAGPFPHGVDFVLPYTGSKVAAALQDQIVVLLQKGKAPPHAGLVTNINVDGGPSRVHFHAPDVATFQLALPQAAGQPFMRHFTYRAIGGVSMGGFGSSVNFWLHPERYDAIGVMGADPGPDLTYTLGMIHDFFLAGFCTTADGANKVGQLCPPKRQLMTDQGEEGSQFEAFNYQAGEGVGLTLSRNTYVKANRDLARAVGNGAYYNPPTNPQSTYLPPGVPLSMLSVPNATFCSTPIVLKKFFDANYNPQGTYDVITFCDGNDSQAVGLGKFDPNTPATNPTEILLAVDVNGNGKRDSGEPVILQGNEPFQDVGIDGKADKDEPGYDPVTNPDPNGDDYHYLWNPTGTEGNWRYDEGEPYQDVGVDGVPMSVGGCPADSGGAQCYDYGEGNGKFDYVPNQLSWRHHDPRSNLEKLAAADLQRLDVYYDAGIRDFFNAQVSTNSLLGALMAQGAPVRAYDGFPALVNAAPSQENKYNIHNVDFSRFGRRLYVRYGDPDLPEATVEQTGDGRHVGTVDQAIHRALTLFYYLASRWPNGDRKIAQVNSSMARIDAMITLSNGRVTPYSVVVPPGYFQPENATKTYPVLYFMHGYGMQPADLAQVAVIAQNAMVDMNVDDAHRMPKFIMVLMDGACRPGGAIQNAPLDGTGDLCEEGQFYTEHADGTAKMETGIVEIQTFIEQNYRVTPPGDVMVSE
jgi:hypothetical protein